MSWFKKDPSEWRKINGKWSHFDGFTLNGKDLSMQEIYAYSLLFTYGDDSELKKLGGKDE